MMEDARFVHMFNYRLPVVCDLLHRGIMCRRDLLFRHQRTITSPEICSTVKIREYRAETYEDIRQLDATYRKQLQVMGNQAPTWSHVPTFDILQSAGLVAIGEEEEPGIAETDQALPMEPMEGVRLFR
jgi:hypothetical protein